MKQYPILDNKAAKGFFGIYLTAMLFLSRDTLFSSSIVGFVKSQLYMIVLIGVLGLWFLMKYRKEMKQIILDKRMIAFGLSAAILLLPMLLKQDWQLMYFSILLCLLFAIFLTYFTQTGDIAKYYVVILCFLCVYSVVTTYGLRKYAQMGQINLPIFYNSNQWDFFNFGLSYAVTWEAWNRNFGIFREPGVYQFFIFLAIYLNNYHVDWTRPWKLWTCNIILAVTMVSTFSIVGYAELALFVVFLYFDKQFYRERWGRIAAAVIVPTVLGLTAILLYFMKNEYFANTILFDFYDIFIRLFTKSDSATDRMDAIVTNIQFFVRNPLAGNTIANVLHGTNHNTSSTLLLFAILGVAGGILNVAAWIALAWKRERNLMGNLILLLILFMSFNTQNLVANIFFWLFPMMTLVERGLPVLKLSRKKE